jgi:hypothetical protein
MVSFPKFRPSFRRATTNEAAADVVAMSTTTQGGKDAAVVEPVPDLTDKPAAELPAEDGQRGVQNVEAVTLIWSKKSLAMIFIK